MTFIILFLKGIFGVKPKYEKKRGDIIKPIPYEKPTSLKLKKEGKNVSKEEKEIY